MDKIVLRVLVSTRGHGTEINDIQDRDSHGSLLHGAYVRYVCETAAEDRNIAAQNAHRQSRRVHHHVQIPSIYHGIDHDHEGINKFAY